MSIHVDVDNLWILEDEYHVEDHCGYSFIYEDALPRFLALLAEFEFQATFFIVGRDLEIPACREFCRAAIAAGHQLGNHSYSHAVRFAKLSAVEKRNEIVGTHDSLVSLTGVLPIGFRAPGYYLDDDVVSALSERGYRYDSSVLPGCATGLMWWYQRIRTGKAPDKTFGRPRDFFASRRPTVMRHEIVEIPIATCPIIRMPVHSTFVYQFGLAYANIAFSILAREAGPHVYLFHAIDLLNYPANGPLARDVIPLRWPFQRREACVRSVFERFRRDFEVTTTERLYG
jgi:peptidoglycan/xylan/chitin deacetylase (PgdA/CDA1 family)